MVQTVLVPEFEERNQHLIWTFFFLNQKSTECKSLILHLSKRTQFHENMVIFYVLVVICFLMIADWGSKVAALLNSQLHGRGHRGGRGR